MLEHIHRLLCFEHGHLLPMLAHPRVVALGETGLDYFKNYSPQDQQREHFRKQIELALELKKPLIIHCRDANQDMIKILREYYPENRDARAGIFHCFSGDQELADAALSMGFYISFSGSVTFKKLEGLREVAKNVPADRLFAETDCPYLSPVPFRGRRNEPAYVSHVAEKLAGIRGWSLEETAKKTGDAFFSLFNKAKRPTS